jgi:hypothetical protein
MIPVKVVTGTKVGLANARVAQANDHQAAHLAPEHGKDRACPGKGGGNGLELSIENGNVQA